MEPIAAVRAAGNESLLKAFASLTHRIHAARNQKDSELELNLRRQRSIIYDEILRRMG